jgi:hypothetical protein
MYRFSTKLLLVAAALAASTSTAFADRRMFTATYEYKTVPEGHTALELWHIEDRATWKDDSPHAMEEILELEHGLTDHWDAALYTVFTQVGAVDPLVAQPFSLHELKVESRYRFADRGELPVDIMAYGEVAREFGGGVYEVEAKAILARDFDKLTLAANLIAEIAFGSDVPETELELGWAAGATYEVHPKLNLGVETYGAIEEDEVAASIGPAIAVAPSGNFWFTFTAGFGLTDEAPKLSGRLIVGVEL